jgi:transcription elongation factor
MYAFIICYNERVKVAIIVNIDKSRSVETSNSHTVERIVPSCLLCESGTAVTTGVLVVIDVASMLSNEHVNVAIIVNIDKSRSAVISNIHTVERIVPSCLFGEANRIRGSDTDGRQQSSGQSSASQLMP